MLFVGTMKLALCALIGIGAGMQFGAGAGLMSGAGTLVLFALTKALCSAIERRPI